MAKVYLLKEEVHRKIAAGEVIERPVSVVKELVENAIDAGADLIKIAITGGGKQLIRVEDNGEGFLADDIALAFERHTTSKLQELSDLDRLVTLGFRGEALPSILEVAEVTLKTSSSLDGKGVQAFLKEGRLQSRFEIGWQKGTVIEVQKLFENFPVRAKFLKSAEVEARHIVAFVEQMALAYPGVAFGLKSNNRWVFDYPKTERWDERIYQIFGREFLDGLQKIDHTDGQFRIQGYASKLNSGISLKNRQFFMVNGRAVKEKNLISSFNKSYQPYLEKNRFPAGVIFFSLPSDQLDVNIHPQKLEIRFRDPGRVYSFVQEAIAQNIGSGNRLAEGQRSETRFTSFVSTPPSDESEIVSPRLFPDVSAGQDDFSVLGQYRQSYIIVERAGELLVVDQHNARERVLFDRLKENYLRPDGAVATPLFPVILELSPSDKLKLNENRMIFFKKSGFDLQELSGNSFEVKTFPALVPESRIAETILAVLQVDMAEAHFEDELLAALACQSAIKVNQKLFPEEMRQVVRELWQSSNPFFCPHRRPIVVTFTLEEIEKLLKRR